MFNSFAKSIINSFSLFSAPNAGTNCYFRFYNRQPSIKKVTDIPN